MFESSHLKPPLRFQDMLPRNQMVNLTSGLKISTALTDVQEAKQWCCGPAFLSRCPDAVVPEPDARLKNKIAVLDGFGFDASPALAALSFLQDGKSASCITMADEKIAGRLLQYVRNKVYDAARQGLLDSVICGFPKFEVLTEALQASGTQQAVDPADYKVTRPCADGSLALVESLMDKFLNCDVPSVKEMVQQQVEKHDAKFNPDKKRIRAQSESPDEPATKKIKFAHGDDDPLTSKDIAELEKPRPERMASIQKI